MRIVYSALILVSFIFMSVHIVSTDSAQLVFEQQLDLAGQKLVSNANVKPTSLKRS